jgi:hypothetical protein
MRRGWDRRISWAQEKRGPRLPTVPWGYPRNYTGGTLAERMYIVKVDLLWPKRSMEWFCSEMERSGANLKHFQNRVHVFPQKSGESDLLTFPAAAFEKDDAGGSNEGFSDDDGPKDAVGMQTERNRQEVG